MADKTNVSKILRFLTVSSEGVVSGLSESSKDMLINAVIVSGLGFFGTLVAAGIIGDFTLTLYAAGVSAGFQFFTSLAVQRGLKTEAKK